MYFLYSLLLSVVFLLMSPLLFLRREKYASGFKQRLGSYPKFIHDGRKVIWLHCVSVGETNAARPLVDSLLSKFPDHRLIVSTTTKTGQELAQKIFEGKADAIFYFPFDWKFSVRQALNNYRPSLVLLMETEIWPRFIHVAKKSGARVAIVNGRLSERSFKRYSKIRGFISRVLSDVDLALMQSSDNANRLISLGMVPSRVQVTGNLKFDQSAPDPDDAITLELRDRFAVNGKKCLVVAASTHEPEEKIVIEALGEMLGETCRLMIAPRHPQRFDQVADLLARSTRSFVRRSHAETASDSKAGVILLDSIGELRSVYPLADIVFVGGSLISHGGQSVVEPAAAGKAIITGPFTQNFVSVVAEFKRSQALIQLDLPDRSGFEAQLSNAFRTLVLDPVERERLGKNALTVVQKNSGAAKTSIKLLRPLLAEPTDS